MNECILSEGFPFGTAARRQWWLTQDGRWRLGYLCLVGFLIASIYLPTLQANFDFADDGATAHSQGIAHPADFQRAVWNTTYAEFLEKGPYRPVAWYFWTGQQELCGGNPFAWRCFRWLWTALSACVLLWFLQEMGFSPGVGALTTMAAMWNPYRAEVWLSLTFCEGIALPFALTGLVCALRAPRSIHAWWWDMGAMGCALAAVGCKNVFAVVIPAQMFLRICTPAISLREGIRQHGWRAAMLGLIMAFPVAHFVCYRLTMHQNRYDMAWDIQQPLRMLNSFLGGVGKDYLGPALACACILVMWACLRGASQTKAGAAASDWRPAFGAASILALLGWAVYAPMKGVAGRYTFPGVWGLDLFCAILWTKAFSLESSWQRKLTGALLACGLFASAVSIVGKQDKNAARIATLWDALYFVEREVPAGSQIAWVAVQDRQRSEELEISEGVHFRWHLQGRGRRDLAWRDSLPGTPRGSAEDPEFLVTSSKAPPADQWQLRKECRHTYWFGRKEVLCCVWQKIPAPRSVGAME